jgi:hypothetical protein
VSRASIKTARRLAGLLLVVALAAAPWFMEEHPATEESCLPPLVWLGEGRCACLPSLVAACDQAVIPGQGVAFVLLLPPALPFAATLLLLLVGERRGARAGYLAAWGLAGAYALLLFCGHWAMHRQVWLWGAGLGAVVTVAMLAGEVLAARGNRREAGQPRTGSSYQRSWRHTGR